MLKHVLLGALPLAALSLGLARCTTAREMRAPCHAAECRLHSGRAYLWQTSSESDDVHIIDIEKRAVVARVLVGPQPHGIAAPRDGRMVYISIEANDRAHGQLVGLDPISLEINLRVDVGQEPHAIATTPDGRWVYVPCKDGNYWVVDAHQRKVVRRIHTGGRPHNTSISRDGKLAYLSPLDIHQATVVDISNDHTVVGQVAFSASLRPPALSSDGARLYQHVDGLAGFEVADTQARRVVARVEQTHSLGWFMLHKSAGWLAPDGLHRCHGLAVRPEHAEVWSVCGAGVTVHSENSSRYAELGRISLPDDAYWITFSPDGRYAFIPMRDQWRVAMVDATSRKVLHYFDVGEAPKRNLVTRTPAAPDAN